jgi:Uma2 family endonuclease
MGMPLAHRRFTVDEYHRMAEVGILGPDDRVELLDGEIVEVSPIGPRHAATVTRLTHTLIRLVGDRALVRSQNPMVSDRYSEPEPDLSLVVPRADYYAESHPLSRDTLLVVEVADTSLRYDRLRKIPNYARAGIPEVWLVDLATKQIERYRDPQGDAYADRHVLGRADSLTVLRLPGFEIPVADLLP